MAYSSIGRTATFQAAKKSSILLWANKWQIGETVSQGFHKTLLRVRLPYLLQKLLKNLHKIFSCQANVLYLYYKSIRYGKENHNESKGS